MSDRGEPSGPGDAWPEEGLELSLPVVEPEHEPILTAMEEALGHRFATRALLLKALVHPSLRDVASVSYERLEFLGDAVLGLAMAEHLFRRFPQYDEGELTRIKSSVVSRNALARLGRRLGIADHLLLGKGMLRGNTLPRSVVANSTEALIGALYLDAGLETAKAFLLENLKDDIQRAIRPQRTRNYKSLLQHLTQGRGDGVPSYRLLGVTGPDHERTFSVSAVLGQREFPPGSGNSKKIAEQRAARNALRILEEAGDEPADSAPP